MGTELCQEKIWLPLVPRVSWEGLEAWVLTLLCCICYRGAEMTPFLWQWSNLWTARKAWEKRTEESKHWVPLRQAIAESVCPSRLCFPVPQIALHKEKKKAKCDCILFSPLFFHFWTLSLSSHLFNWSNFTSLAKKMRSTWDLLVQVFGDRDRNLPSWFGLRKAWV